MKRGKQPEGVGSRPTKRRRAVVAAVFLSTLFAAVAVGVLVGNETRRATESRFQRTGAQAATSVQTQLGTYFEKLQDTSAFVAANPRASRAEFATYVRSSGIFQDLPWLDGVALAEKVEPGDLQRWEAARQVVDPDFRVVRFNKAETGEPHYILSQYEPGRSAMQLPVGFDASELAVTRRLASLTETTRHAVATSIRDDPAVAAAAKQLSPESESFLALDFYVGVPVLAAPADPSVPASYRGVLIAPIGKFERVFAAVVQGQPDDIGLSLTVDLASTNGVDHPDLHPTARQDRNAGPPGEAALREERSFQIDGVTWHLAVWSPAHIDDGTTGRNVVFAIGALVAFALAGLVHFRWRAHDELQVRAQLQHDIIDSVNDAMVVLDDHGTIVAANPAWSRLGFFPKDGGWHTEEGRTLYLEAVSDSVIQGFESLTLALTRVHGGVRSPQDVDVQWASGGTVRHWFSVRVTPLRGPQGGAVVVHSDITGLKLTQQEFEFQARHDRLTGLLNRAALENHLDVVLNRATAVNRVGVLFVDLDGFKAINDNCGHAVGDEVLSLVAQRLRTVVRPGDQIGRLGGDEFVVVLAPLPHPDVALATAERLIDVVAQPLNIGGRILPLGASVGVAIAPAGQDRAALLQRADQAMYRAKRAGGGRFVAATGP